MGYILVTPAKNEGNNLPKLIQCVTEQTIKPLVWAIVDDGSIDNTVDIIKRAKEQYTWIKSIRLEGLRRDLSKNYAYVCNTGFEFAIKYCEKNNLKYDFIGLLDADMLIEPGFYSKMIEEFVKNPKLGIASGSLYYSIKDRLIIKNDREDLPLGSIRLWAKKCFEETGGGYYIGYSSDAVSNVLAKLRGWETRRFKEIRAVQTRETSSAEGLWKGYKYHGESAYFRNYHPLFVLAKGIKYSFEGRYFIGIAYLYGYLWSAIRRIDQIDNKELRDYYFHQKYKEVMQCYLVRLKRKAKRYT